MAISPDQATIGSPAAETVSELDFGQFLGGQSATAGSR